MPVVGDARERAEHGPTHQDHLEQRNGKERPQTGHSLLQVPDEKDGLKHGHGGVSGGEGFASVSHKVQTFLAVGAGVRADESGGGQLEERKDPKTVSKIIFCVDYNSKY